MIINCKEVAEQTLEQVKEETSKLTAQGLTPRLDIVRVLGDEASARYVASKVKACEKVGIESNVWELPNNITQDELLDFIDTLNYMDEVNAILVQLPLPKGLDEEIVINRVVPHKDVDCLSIPSVGSLFTGNDIVQPCTPKGIMKVIKHNNIDLIAKDVLLIGRSMLVGKPLVELLQRENATIQLAHSKTQYLEEKLYNSDVVITAAGVKDLIKYCYLEEIDDHLGKLGRTIHIIDVSINSLEDGKLCGDVENNCKAKVNMLESLSNIYVTPVPGGIGLTTVSSLLENTITLSKLQRAMFG